MALAQFGNLVVRSGEVPKDGSGEEGRVLNAA